MHERAWHRPCRRLAAGFYVNVRLFSGKTDVACLRLGFVPARDGCNQASSKGIWWMPWHQEAMKDVARCDKPRGAVSKL